MATWSISPTYKKSIREVQYWTNNNGDTIVNELVWRWGDFRIVTEDDNPPDLDPEGNFDLMDCGYDVDEFETDDCVYEDANFDDCDELIAEEVQTFLDDGNSIYDLDGPEWSLSESELWIECPIKIEKISD